MHCQVLGLVQTSFVFFPTVGLLTDTVICLISVELNEPHKILEGGVKLETSKYKWSITPRVCQEKIPYFPDSRFSKCDRHTSSMDMTWGFVENEESPAPPQTY